MAEDTDYSKSTGAYSTPSSVPVVIDPSRLSIDYSKSTGAFPMDPAPEWRRTDDVPDFGKSTGAYEMYDGPDARTTVAEHVDAPVVPEFETPGPQSAGDPAVVELLNPTPDEPKRGRRGATKDVTADDAETKG